MEAVRPPETPPKEKRLRKIPPKPPKEVSMARERKKREEKVAAIYQNLKESGKTYGDILAYMREYRAYPGYARSTAAKKLLEDITTGKVTPEMIEQFKKTKQFEEGAAPAKRREMPRVKGKIRGVYPDKKTGVYYTGKGLPIDELDKLELGPPQLVEGMKESEAYQEGARWNKQEWYNFLLRQYLARPEYARKKIEDYLKKHKDEDKKYSSKAFEAHERLLAEMEGRELGEKFRVREEKAEEELLSEREVEDLILAALKFKDEYIKDLPAEGKRVFEQMLEEQTDAFRQILHGTISPKDLEKRIIEKKAAEIQAKENLGPAEARAKAEALVGARAAVRAEAIKAGEEIESLKVKIRKAGAKKKEVGATEEGRAEKETDYKKKMEEFGKLDAGLKEAQAAAEKELVSEAARKFLAERELIVHYNGGWDPEKGFVMGRFSDSDGQGAVALYAKAGIDVKNGAYVPPGYRRLGAQNIDASLADGLVFENREVVDPETGEKKLETTMYSDHHGIYSDRDSSATKNMFEVFTKLGLLKFESEEERRAWEKTVEFITQADNYTFPGVKGGEFYKTRDGLVNGRKVYETSYRRLVGYATELPFDTILKFFMDQERKPEQDRKTPLDTLSHGELRRYGLYGKELSDKDLKDDEDIKDDEEFLGSKLYGKRVVERAKEINRNKKIVDALIKDGFVVTTKSGKRLVVDIGNKMHRSGQWAAGSRGYDGTLVYRPKESGFKVALNEGIFDEPIQELLLSRPQGILIRGGMFLKTSPATTRIGEEEEMSEKTREMLERNQGDLLVTLGDLVENIADSEKKNEFGRGLKDFLDKERREGRLIRTNIFKIEEREAGKRGVVFPTNWRAKTPDGTPVIVKNVPDNFVSGEEGLIKLKNKERKKFKGEENIGWIGKKWSGDPEEEIEVDVWTGEWEKPKFPELTAEDWKIKDAVAAVMRGVRKTLEGPEYAAWTDEQKQTLLQEMAEKLESEMGKPKEK